MTVKELILKLKTCNQDAEVVLSTFDSYHGFFRESDLISIKNNETFVELRDED